MNMHETNHSRYIRIEKVMNLGREEERRVKDTVSALINERRRSWAN